MRSLYSKLILFTIGIMLASGLIAFLAVNTFYHQQLKAQNDEKNIQIATDIASSIKASDAIVIDDFLQTIADVGYKIAVVNRDYETRFYGEAFRKDNLPENAMKLVLSGHNYHGMRDFPKETFVTGFFADEVANTAGVPFEHQGETFALFIRPNIKMLFTEVHYLLGGMFIVMGIVSLIGIIYLARQLIKPIVKLTTATQQISDEEFTVTLPTNRKDEIGQLAGSFEAMANKLAASDRLRKQFINDVTHDFQTPLQNIQGYADLLHETDISTEDRLAYTDIIQSETKRLSVLTKQLLLLTSLDSLTHNVTKKRVSLSQQIKDVLQTHRWLIEDKNISIITEIPDCDYVGDPASLEKIWDNLLSNAIKYSLPDGLVELHLQETNDTVVFTIKDNGIGMDEQQIPHLFDRFYRADNSRHAEIAGTGLGLAIVEQVIRLHDGKISVTSSLDNGSIFKVILPKDKTQ